MLGDPSGARARPSFVAALFLGTVLVLLGACGQSDRESDAAPLEPPAGMKIEGWEQLPPRAQRDAAAALASLPPEHLEKVALLRFDASQQQAGRALRTEATVSLGYRLWTEYLGRPHRVPPVTALEEILVHEIGHLVAFADGGRLERRFNPVFWSGKQQLFSRPVDDAGTDPIEDFAVTYSQYRYNGDYLSACCPERSAFMRDEVFGGRVWPPGSSPSTAGSGS